MKLASILLLIAAGAYLIAAAPAPPAMHGAFTAQAQAAAPAQPPSAAADATSNPIGAGDDAFGTNIRCALDSNNAALRDFTVQPGATWSFNASITTQAAACAVVVAGVLGGGWCNLAARYAQVGRAVGMVVDFEDHGLGDLGGGAENSVAIWNVDGTAGSAGDRQDLLLTNTSRRPIHFAVVDAGGGQVAVQAAIA